MINLNFVESTTSSLCNSLTHWGRVTHICVSKITIIGSDNGLSPGRRQAIIWTSVGILLIGPLGTNFSEFLIEIYIFSFKKMHLKMSSGKWRPFCLGLNVLIELCGCFLAGHEAIDDTLSEVFPDRSIPQRRLRGGGSLTSVSVFLINSTLLAHVRYSFWYYSYKSRCGPQKFGLQHLMV